MFDLSLIINTILSTVLFWILTLTATKKRRIKWALPFIMGIIAIFNSIFTRMSFGITEGGTFTALTLITVSFIWIVNNIRRNEKWK